MTATPYYGLWDTDDRVWLTSGGVLLNYRAKEIATAHAKQANELNNSNIVAKPFTDYYEMKANA